ncbi:unnamed protein product [Eruca vesicaria subsp. sativa]|uniref:Uncharacterized protein n=1 Tax=Eruca vesicaria subsp. sativa TaxID=29727 RepID=A0ABC8KQ92_ERUVS|nr:unnamed protein product [Eruca vesicaria subsp. sativa]
MKKGGKEIALETNDFDFGLSTQDMNKLSQDTFVDGFDPSQVKVEKLEKQSKSRAKKTSTPQLRDELIRRAGEGSPDAPLVYIRESDWEKTATDWTSDFRS